MKNIMVIIGIIIIGFLSYFSVLRSTSKPLLMPVSTPFPTSTPSPSPTPTPSPLTFAQMNELYGPCVYVPTLMYHHIENLEAATADNHAGLTVSDITFRGQMQYLKDRGYIPVKMQDIINFFDAGTPVAGKSVLLTFDDGYDDNNNVAYPILREFNYPATVFLATGLMENPGYLTWNQINDMKNSGLMLFANHTWSHKNVGAQNDIVEKEIMTADTQLKDHNQNQPKIFSYPYGIESGYAMSLLSKNSYQLAFTTQPGSTLCRQLRFELPRIRIGNVSLANYGF